jgi:anti-anti-sigma regulatory factor
LCSSGAAALVRVWKAVMRQGGMLIVLRPRGDLARMLAWMGLDHKLLVADELPA